MSDSEEVEDEMEDFMTSAQGQMMLQTMVHMVPSPYTYPFWHASTRMSVIGSGLLVASPMYMPRYVLVALL